MGGGGTESYKPPQGLAELKQTLRNVTERFTPDFHAEIQPKPSAWKGEKLIKIQISKARDENTERGEGEVRGIKKRRVCLLSDG